MNDLDPYPLNPSDNFSHGSSHIISPPRGSPVHSPSYRKSPRWAILELKLWLFTRAFHLSQGFRADTQSSHWDVVVRVAFRSTPAEFFVMAGSVGSRVMGKSQAIIQHVDKVFYNGKTIGNDDYDDYDDDDYDYYDYDYDDDDKGYSSFFLATRWQLDGNG